MKARAECGNGVLRGSARTLRPTAGRFNASTLQRFNADARAFTLVELMIVIGILAIVLATGLPPMLRAMQKEGLRKAESDLLEACSHARAQAILTGGPMELVIRAEGSTVSVAPLQGAATPAQAERSEEESNAPRKPKAREFSARLDEEIGIRLLAVNFKNLMDSPEARVRFFPNGTSDEFSIVFFTHQGERLIRMDVVTGVAELTVIR